MLEYHAVSDMQVLYIIAYFDYLPNYLVARIGANMAGNGCRCYAEISICEDKVEIAAADTCKQIAYTHPVRSG